MASVELESGTWIDGYERKSTGSNLQTVQCINTKTMRLTNHVNIVSQDLEVIKTRVHSQTQNKAQ